MAMVDFSENTLVIAIGNASRGDDGLGWAFAEALENAGIFPGEIVLRYQLQVEDAELCAHFEQVIFVDAWKTESEADFSFEPCEAAPDLSFTTHEVSPQAILYLCKDLYGRDPECWLLLLRGEVWDLGAELSEQGKKGLEKGMAFFSGSTLAR